MTRSFWNDSPNRLRAPIVEGDFGNDQRDWTRASSLTISSCRIQPASAKELDARRSGAEVSHRRFAPLGADVAMVDRIKFEGHTYDVVLPPNRHRGVSGDVAHIEIDLREVIG